MREPTTLQEQVDYLNGQIAVLQRLVAVELRTSRANFSLQGISLSQMLISTGKSVDTFLESAGSPPPDFTRKGAEDTLDELEHLVMG